MLTELGTLGTLLHQQNNALRFLQSQVMRLFLGLTCRHQRWKVLATHSECVSGACGFKRRTWNEAKDVWGRVV